MTRRRQDRVARVNRKRPPYAVTVERDPDDAAPAELVAVLFDVLAPLVRK